jgi:hypothetical protein
MPYADPAVKRERERQRYRRNRAAGFKDIRTPEQKQRRREYARKWVRSENGMRYAYRYKDLKDSAFLRSIDRKLTSGLFLLDERAMDRPLFIFELKGKRKTERLDDPLPTWDME